MKRSLLLSVFLLLALSGPTFAQDNGDDDANMMPGQHTRNMPGRDDASLPPDYLSERKADRDACLRTVKHHHTTYVCIPRHKPRHCIQEVYDRLKDDPSLNWCR